MWNTVKVAVLRSAIESWPTCEVTRKSFGPSIGQRKTTHKQSYGEGSAWIAFKSISLIGILDIRSNETRLANVVSDLWEQIGDGLIENLSLSVASSMVMVAIMPWVLIAPRMVMIFQWLPGIASWMRQPPRHRAYSRVIEVVTPLSSRKITSSSGAEWISSRNCARRF